MLGNLDINDCNQDLQELIRSTNGGVGFLKNTLTLTANSATAVLGFVYNTSTDALLVFQNGKYLEKDQYKVGSDGGYITPMSGSWTASTSSPLIFNFILLKAIPLNMVSIDGSLIADGTINFSKVDSNFMTKMIREFEDNYHMDATVIENGTIDITKLTQRIQDDISAFERHILYTNAGHIPYGVASMTSQNVYTVSVIPKPTAYYDGMPVSIKIQNDATGASTINVDSLGARAIKKANGADVKNFKKNGIYTLRYNSSTANFILQGEGGSGNATPSDLRSGKTASTDDGDITGIIPDLNYKEYTVQTTNQVISAGQYINQDQLIKGYPDLLPENIADGKRIGDVTGTLVTLDNSGNIFNGRPYLNIGKTVKVVLMIDNNNFYYLDDAYNLNKYDANTKTSSYIGVNMASVNPNNRIPRYIGKINNYYVIGAALYDTNFNLVFNLYSLNIDKVGVIDDRNNIYEDQEKLSPNILLDVDNNCLYFISLNQYNGRRDRSTNYNLSYSSRINVYKVDLSNFSYSIVDRIPLYEMYDDYYQQIAEGIGIYGGELYYTALQYDLSMIPTYCKYNFQSKAVTKIRTVYAEMYRSDDAYQTLAIMNNTMYTINASDTVFGASISYSYSLANKNVSYSGEYTKRSNSVLAQYVMSTFDDINMGVCGATGVINNTYYLFLNGVIINPSTPEMYLGLTKNFIICKSGNLYVYR